MNYELGREYTPMGGNTPPLQPDDQKFVDRYMMDTYKRALSTMGAGLVLLLIVVSILYRKI